MAEQFGVAEGMKSALWEEAKGKLRALVQVQGCYHDSDPHTKERFRKANARVEAFIKEFADDSLHE